jgi:nucleotide-binding universal stress UspA family protein
MQTMIENQFQKCVLASPDHILVATDLTDTEYLVPHAIAQAKACGAQVTFIHVISSGCVAPIEIEAFSYGALSYVDPAKVIRDARLMLLGIEHQVEAHGITCETRVRHGNTNEVIRRELRLTGATRLIVGTHGRGKLGQLVLGSVAHQLLATVDIPVFVVGPHARGSVEHITPRNLLHPVSLIGDYRNSVQFALNVAQTCRAELTLLHVVDPDVTADCNPTRILEWADNTLKSPAPAATDLVPPVHAMVTCGELAEEILKAADQIQADWIVLGANGGSHRWPFNESVAYKALTAANCPVLTLRHEPSHTEIKALQKLHSILPPGLHERDARAHQTHRNIANFS